MMTSLRVRLFVGLTSLIFAAGFGAGTWAFNWAYDEAIEFQDSLLLQVGALAVRTQIPEDEPTLHGVDKEAQVVIEEFKPGSPATSGILPLAGLPGDAPDGLQTVAHGSEEWRVLIKTRVDGSRFAIGQSGEYRNEMAQGSAIRTVIPIAVLFPCLMLLVGIVVRTSFRPLSQIAAEIDAKKTDHMQKLPVDGIPKELLPFVESINRLLDRIGILFDQQRRFVADAAHELRTPITALSLQIENLEHVDLSPGARERIGMLKSGARRSTRLLEQLLTLARFEASSETTPPVTRLDDVSREVVADALQRASARNIDLGFERCEPAAVRANPASLAVLVRNLIENAIRYAPDNGRIDLVVGGEGGQAMFQVSDNGPGVAEADMPRIFEPFFRGARPMGDGTGLGLSIVERICKRLRGTVTVENIAKQGTPAGLRVTVWIPLAA
jgi:two-component system OmpR family sensor kinase